MSIVRFITKIHRGQTFRSTMERLGEIRSLLPHQVHIMALTATATKSLRLSVSCTLGMENPVVITLSPCKENIRYHVGTFTTVSETFKPFVKRLMEDHDKAPRTTV